MATMIRHGWPTMAACLALLVLACLLNVATYQQPAIAADPVTAARTAKASGLVIKQRFVTITAAGTIRESNQAADRVVGVAESNATNNSMVSYAPAGTISTVRVGEAVDVGQLLVAGESGYAYVLDTDAEATQRVAGEALTASPCDANGYTVQVLIGNSTAEQRRTITGTLTVNGPLTMGDANLAATVGLLSGQAATVTGLTVNGTATLSGPVTMDDANLTLTAGVISAKATTVAGTLTVNGPLTMGDANLTATVGVLSGQAATVTGLTVNGTATLSGPVTMDDANLTLTAGVVSAQATTVAGTLTVNGPVTMGDANLTLTAGVISAQSGTVAGTLTVNGPLTMGDANLTFTGGAVSAASATVAGTLTINGGMTTADANLGVPHTVVQPLVVNTTPGIPFVVAVEANAATRNYDFTVPAGYTLRVLDVWTVTDANSAENDPNDASRVINGTGTNYITGSMACNQAADTRIAPGTISKTHQQVAAGGTLRVTYTNVDGSGCRVYVLCSWAK